MTSQPPRRPALEKVPPPHVVASPADGQWLLDSNLPFWKPSWIDSIYLIGWRWIYCAPALLILPGILFVAWTFRGWTLIIAYWKLLILVAAIPVTTALHAMRKAVRNRPEPFCIHCGYTLTGLPDGHTCPECGRPFSLRIIDEYRRDPDGFIARCRSNRTLPQSAVPFPAGPVRSKRSRDGT